jgi:hypothetical protein
LWRNWNPCTLGGGMQNGGASTEKNMDIPENFKRLTRKKLED